MPQLEIADFAPQIFWLVVTFATLYLIMARAALPRVADILRTREERIVDDIDKAESLNKEARDALEGYEQALSDARTRAHEIAQERREEVQAEIKDAQAQAEGELAKKTDDAESRITAARDKAMANVREIATGAAGEIVSKLIGTRPDASKLEEVVGAELSQVKGS